MLLPVFFMIRLVTMMLIYVLTVSLLLTPFPLIPQALPITIDGEFDDWEEASLLFTIDDNGNSHDVLHVIRLHGANDDRFLFLRIELDREITLLENNPLVLFLDTDNDNTTGYDPHNVGAELRWEFGERSGIFYTGTDEYEIRFRDIRLRTAPTVTSTEFEIAIGRDATPFSSIPLFQSDTVRVYVQFDEAANYSYASGTYIFDPEPVPPPEPIPLERHNVDDLRILAFNAWDDKVFETEFTGQYQRILSVLRPDIIAFQEIWNHDAQETAQRVENLIPSEDEYEWHAVKQDNGNVTVSKFPILDSWQILNGSRMTAVLIDTREDYGTKLMLVNVHLRCCAWGEDNRWQEIAALTNFINNAREPGGLLQLDEGTPVILAGDFNLVGSSGQLAAIETDILDWDGTGLERVRARQTEKRMHYTWRNDWSWFSPGKLDYIFYSGSVLSLKNHYTLQVEEMSVEQRALYGLQYGDTQAASDHLPHIADFEVQPATGVRDKRSVDDYHLGQNYPNPFNPATSFSFSIPETTEVTIILYDILGKKVKSLLDAEKPAGNYSVNIDAFSLASGVYFYTMRTDDYLKTRRMVVLR